jgi:uncharacterized protein (TIGR03067 family)
MRKVWILGAVALTLAVAATGWAGGAGDKDKLQGSWKLTNVYFGGKEMPGGKAITITFAGDKVSFKEGDKGAEEGTYKIDPTKKPKQIDLTKGKDGKDEAKGIYSLEGDTLKIGIGFSLKKEEVAARPPSFEDPGCITMTFKKESK